MFAKFLGVKWFHGKKPGNNGKTFNHDCYYHIHLVNFYSSDYVKSYVIVVIGFACQFLIGKALVSTTKITKVAEYLF